VERQHGVVSRRQLLAFGLSAKAIEHRIAAGRLRPLWPGVYVVGRPEVSERGRWMAAVLACGPSALLSHHSAAVLWGIVERRQWAVHVSVPERQRRRQASVIVHRRSNLRRVDATRRDGIPVTSLACTVVDVAVSLRGGALEAVVNAADRDGLADPDQLRAQVALMPPRPGLSAIKRLLDRHTFTLTDSELERRFLPLVRRAGLPRPVTRETVNGFRVDFQWPALRLVVETDGLRYHRTPAQQARDRRRDQVHAAAGWTPLRFTHAQVCFEPAYVVATLKAVAGRIGTSLRHRDHDRPIGRAAARSTDRRARARR
jgi:very-short-patch-repair endonuclease